MHPDRPIFIPSSPRTLPPLILHPLSDPRGAERLASSARASLVLQGLLPDDGLISQNELLLQLQDGHYCEIRMLFYIGKDICRWLGQCLEFAGRDEELDQAGLQRQSFAHLLIEDPPAAVSRKLKSWGVTGYAAIFRRALALHEVFAELPSREALTASFLRNHHRYADALFEALTETPGYPLLRCADFPFELYASGEYARLLEQQWNTFS